MGVKNLWDILESCKQTLPLHYLQNKRVCVDLSCWIVQLQNVHKPHSGMAEKLYLRSLFHRLRALIALNCSLIFVTDGSIPALKLAAYRQRLKSGIEASEDEKNLQRLTSLKRNAGSEFSRMIKEAKSLGLTMGIPCLDGIEEAEAQCALLNAESLCDGCFSSDSDAFLFGARTVYRDICVGEAGYVICYEMADIENKLGFGRNSLITLALLLGSDYSRGVHGLGVESACQVVRSVENENILQLIISEGLSFVKKKKCSKRHVKALNSLKSQISIDKEECDDGTSKKDDKRHEFAMVIDAYLKSKCHSPDASVVYSVLSQHLLQHAELQQICSNYFGWPVDKTDSYILPKIAERDLRRYACLRQASSEVGLLLPMSKIPVRCPVTEVVKHRKIGGQDYFDVRWEGFDGLDISAIPVDLLQRACPEKIAEFQARMANKHENRRKPISKKKLNVSMAQINLELQMLLLVDESMRTAPSNSLPSIDTSKAASANSFSKLLGTLSSSSELLKSTPVEIIDLRSPSPYPRSENRSTCGPNFHQNVGPVIDLCDDSDIEPLSPEHAKKARELRLFLASIRNDMH